jgi:hypothetical protein
MGKNSLYLCKKIGLATSYAEHNIISGIVEPTEEIDDK